MVSFEEQIVLILMTYNLLFFSLFIAYILGITRINIRVKFHQVIWKHEFKAKRNGDFPSGSVANSLCSQIRGNGFDLWSGN